MSKGAKQMGVGRKCQSWMGEASCCSGDRLLHLGREPCICFLTRKQEVVIYINISEHMEGQGAGGEFELKIVRVHGSFIGKNQ